MNKIVLYCRPGFEKECAAEITGKAISLEIYGFVRIKDNSGYVLFECYQHQDADYLAKTLPIQSFIFARQLFVAGELLKDLPIDDRISPITGMLVGVIEKASDVRVEVPDTNQGKELMKFCRKLTVPLRRTLREQKILLSYEKTSQPVIHVFFIASGCCYVGYSYSNYNSPLFMGILRLKFPLTAPSRSTLKLEEAFHSFIPYDEWEERVANGMYAVDLGACPGGWTYQLVKRGMMVQAVDNGFMSQTLMDTGQVIHLCQDAFRFVPARSDISWVVCDMIEKPARVTQLMVDWMSNGWAREAIFNLKLPMKKRYEAVCQNLELLRGKLQQQGINIQIQAKQLYHDREEITVHVRRIWAASPGRLDEREDRR